MSDQRDRMLRGEWYKDSAPTLVEDRRRCQKLLDRFNGMPVDADTERQSILRELLGEIGEGSWVMPRLQCDYGYLVRVGCSTVRGFDAEWVRPCRFVPWAGVVGGAR